MKILPFNPASVGAGDELHLNSPSAIPAGTAAPSGSFEKVLGKSSTLAKDVNTGQAKTGSQSDSLAVPPAVGKPRRSARTLAASRTSVQGEESNSDSGTGSEDTAVDLKKPKRSGSKGPKVVASGDVSDLTAMPGGPLPGQVVDLSLSSKIGLNSGKLEALSDPLVKIEQNSAASGGAGSSVSLATLPNGPAKPPVLEGGRVIPGVSLPGVDGEGVERPVNIAASAGQEFFGASNSSPGLPMKERPSAQIASGGLDKHLQAPDVPNAATPINAGQLPGAIGAVPNAPTLSPGENVPQFPNQVASLPALPSGQKELKVPRTIISATEPKIPMGNATVPSRVTTTVPLTAESQLTIPTVPAQPATKLPDGVSGAPRPATVNWLGSAKLAPTVASSALVASGPSIPNEVRGESSKATASAAVESQVPVSGVSVETFQFAGSSDLLASEASNQIGRSQVRQSQIGQKSSENGEPATSAPIATAHTSNSNVTGETLNLPNPLSAADGSRSLAQASLTPDLAVDQPIQNVSVNGPLLGVENQLPSETNSFEQSAQLSNAPSKTDSPGEIALPVSSKPAPGSKSVSAAESQIRNRVEIHKESPSANTVNIPGQSESGDPGVTKGSDAARLGAMETPPRVRLAPESGTAQILNPRTKVPGLPSGRVAKAGVGVIVPGMIRLNKAESLSQPMETSLPITAAPAGAPLVVLPGVVKTPELPVVGTTTPKGNESVGKLTATFETTEKAQATTEKAQATTEKAQATTEKAQVTTEKAQSSGELAGSTEIETAPNDSSVPSSFGTVGQKIEVGQGRERETGTRVVGSLTENRRGLTAHFQESNRSLDAESLNPGGTLDAKQVTAMARSAKNETGNPTFGKNIPMVGRNDSLLARADQNPSISDSRSVRSDGFGSERLDSTLLSNMAAASEASKTTEHRFVEPAQAATIRAGRLSEHVWSAVESFQATGAKDWEVKIRPDQDTQLHLRLTMQDNRLLIQAKVESGNGESMAPRWGELQAFFAGRGVELRPLEFGTAQNWNSNHFNHFGSPRQDQRQPQPEFARTEDFVEASVAVSPEPPRSRKPSSGRASPSGGAWETWA